MASIGRTVALRGSLGDLRALIGSRRLAARAAAGDERAFAEIFEKHHQELYRYCLSILRNPADAEDALQSAMAKALRALPGEEREMQLRPWLFRVAHNEAISLLRARRPADQTAATEETLAGGVEPAQELEQSERLRALVEDLNELPERQRGALVMRELSGLSYDEIGAALDCGDGAARQTVYEARIALQVREEGRQMECADVRQAISIGDRRRLRGRAHQGPPLGLRRLRRLQDGDQRPAAGPGRSRAADGDRRLGGDARRPARHGRRRRGAAAVGAGAGAAGAGAGVTTAAGGIAGGVGGITAAKGASILAAVAIAAGGAGEATGVDGSAEPAPRRQLQEQRTAGAGRGITGRAGYSKRQRCKRKRRRLLRERRFGRRRCGREAESRADRSRAGGQR